MRTLYMFFPPDSSQLSPPSLSNSVSIHFPFVLYRANIYIYTIVQIPLSRAYPNGKKVGALS